MSVELVTDPVRRQRRKYYSPEQKDAARKELAEMMARPWGKRGSNTRHYHRLNAIVWHDKHPEYAKEYMRKYNLIGK